MRRILIVEDDPSVGAAIQMMLTREGFQTSYAPDAETGLKALEEFRFDLAIVDIFMPGMNGLVTIAKFRQIAPEMQILAMSGFKFRDSMNPGLDFLSMATEAGARVCLRKPFAPRQLIEAVHASFLETAPPALVASQSRN